MATATGQRRRSPWLTLILLGVLIIVGLATFQWITSLILNVVRLILIVIAFVVMGRIGLFLLRKGPKTA